MSLFGSLIGDFEDDPFFGSHMQSMQRINSMMNSMFADPFGMMGGPQAIMDGHHQQNRMGGMQMMPFGFPAMQSMSMGRLFSDLENMNQNPNCHSYTSSSIMTMTSGSDGRPQVYQESMSTLTAPGGVKETKKTVSDSRTGTRKMAIGHHIGERAHILERQQNMRSGEQEEHQEFINLEEEEAETFNKEWESRTKRSSMGAINAPSYNRSHNPYSRGQEPKQLALPSTTSNRQSKHQSRQVATPKRTSRPSHSRQITAPSSSRSNEKSTSTSTSSSSSKPVPLESPQNLTTPSRRKRERTPDPEDDPKSKRLSTKAHTSSSSSDDSDDSDTSSSEEEN